MAFFKGRSFVLKLGASGAGGTVAAIQNLSIALNNEGAETTNKDDAGWRTFLQDAGLKSATISGDGVASDSSTYETLKGYAQANSINTFQLIDEDGDTVEGSFHISNFTQTGGVADAMTFSITLESSGSLTFGDV